MAKVSEAAIVTEDLTKIYKGIVGTGVTALEDLNIRVQQGEIFGLVGPNGSGKTTTLKLLLGLIFPTRGKITVLGTHVRDPAYRQRVGFLPDGPYFYDYLTSTELLRFYGGLFGLGGAELNKRIDELLELVGMNDPVRRALKIREYSKGMIQRVGIAQALLNDPEIVFLDEPTSGLDPIGSLQMREIILEMRERNKTVFLCSHLLAEVERICDHVTILHNGRTVRQGAVVDLLESAGTFAVTARDVNGGAMKKLEEAAQSVKTSEGITEAVVHSQEEALRLAGIITDAGGELLSVGRRRRSLEDVFVESTEEAL